jgi:hypothetical protein
MRYLIVLLALSGCVGKPPQKSVVIPFGLRYCDTDTHKPKALPAIRTEKDVAKSYNDLELSREAVIKQLRECDSKRDVTLKLLKGTEK